MRQTTRRRMLRISAGLLGVGLGSSAPAAQRLRWTGSALGAAASIDLDGVDPDKARGLIGRTLAEIDRLESIFSLQRSDSALSQLNRDGRLDMPPAELVTVLQLAAMVSDLSEGAFDVTVQPLWRLHAQAAAVGRPVQGRDLDRVRALVDWRDVEVSPWRVALRRKGVAVTLNGIAQGYIADRVVELLRDAGLGHALVDVGERRALGRATRDRPWRLLTPGGPVDLVDGAVAVSADGVEGPFAKHLPNIISPHSGQLMETRSAIVVVAESAILADALSTALAAAPVERAMQFEARLARLRARAVTVVVHAPHTACSPHGYEPVSCSLP